MSIRLSLLFAALIAPVAAHAGDLSGRLEAGSDAFYRGFRENNGPSFAARADYGYGDGLYVGGGVANDRSVGDGRLDLHAGMSRSLQFAGYIPYRVDGGISGSLFSGGGGGPFRGNPDFVEAYGSLGLGPVTGNVAASPDYYGLGRAGYRLGGALRLPLLPALALGVQAGWNSGKGVSRYVAIRTAGRHARNYADYGATLSVALPWAFTASAQVVATDLSGDRTPRAMVGLRRDFSF